jgi:hypothetical protein
MLHMMLVATWCRRRAAARRRAHIFNLSCLSFLASGLRLTNFMVSDSDSESALASAGVTELN